MTSVDLTFGKAIYFVVYYTVNKQADGEEGEGRKKKTKLLS